MRADDGFGRYAWTKRTAGVLTPAERRRCFAAIIGEAVRYIPGLMRSLTGRVPRTDVAGSFASLRRPDTPLGNAAEDACLEQPLPVVRHAYRTWAYGCALAGFDQEPLDAELFYVACLLHDHGLTTPHPGEDFTIRSAERASRCVREAGRADHAGRAVADAITLHVTPGIRRHGDAVLGYYVQAGSMLDLSGRRASDLTRSYHRAVAGEYPRDGVTKSFIDLVRAEAVANPRSRFGLLYRCGMTLTFRLNPL